VLRSRLIATILAALGVAAPALPPRAGDEPSASKPGEASPGPAAASPEAAPAAPPSSPQPPSPPSIRSLKAWERAGEGLHEELGADQPPLSPEVPALKAWERAGERLREAIEAERREAAPTTSAFLDLYVNEAPGGTVLVVMDRGDAWVAPEDLARAGLARLEGHGVRREIEARTMISLRSLAPEVTFDVDEAGLALRIHAAVPLLGRSIIDLTPSRRPTGIVMPSVPSAFLNYAARADSAAGPSGFAEVGASGPHQLFNASLSWSRDLGPVRGLTTYTVDRAEELLRFTAGDAVIAPVPLGGAPILLGLGAARDLSLDPYLVRAPLPAATVFASSPSTLEVWIDGRLARTQQVAPGTYDLSNLPLTTGANDVRVVVRDAFGRTQTLATGHYLAQGLLARGLHEWAWNLGAVRRGYGVESFDYGGPALLGHHRYGFTNWLTAGGRLEAAEGLEGGTALVSGGPSATVSTPLGEWDFSAAASVSRCEGSAPCPWALAHSGRTGSAGLAAWRFGGRLASVSLDAEWTSRRYAQISLDPRSDRDRWSAGAVASLAAGTLVSFSGELAASRTWLGYDLARGTVRATVRMGSQLWAVASVTGARGGAAGGSGVYLQLVWAGPQATTVDATTATHGHTGAFQAGAQKSLPVGDGWGGWARGGMDGPTSSASFLAQGQTSFGRAEAGWDSIDKTSAGHVAASGALVLIEGGLFASRPIDQGYALVQGGAPGVGVTVENQPVGRTDRNGNLLVPGLLPYYGNRIAITHADVPLDWRLGQTEKLVAVAPRGAARVRFDVERMRAWQGWIWIRDGGAEQPPAYGTLVVDGEGRQATSPLAEDGAFWIEGVPPGKYRARVEWRGRACTFTLSLPASDAPVTDLGDVRCLMGAAPPEWH